MTASGRKAAWREQRAAGTLAAGLFQGDAGARLASLTLKNDIKSRNLRETDLGDAVDDDAPTIAVPAFAGGARANDAEEEDDVVQLPADAEDSNVSDAETDLGASEFGAVRYWGSSIDASLVPDDA